MGDKIFSQLDNLAMFLQLRYMRSKKTSEMVSKNIIRFHPQDVSNYILQEYQKRLKTLTQS